MAELVETKLWRWTKYGLGIVLASAIGRATWDWFMARIFNYIGDIFLKGWALLFSADSLHKHIGKGHIDNFGFLPYMLITLAIIIFPWGIIIKLLVGLHSIEKALDNNSPTAPSNNTMAASKEHLRARIYKNKKIIYGFLIPAAVLLTITYSASFYESAYSHRAVVWIERSLDILAPRVGVDNSLGLRAEYRAIDNAIKFYDFEDKLRRIARTNNVALPEFRSIR